MRKIPSRLLLPVPLPRPPLVGRLLEVENELVCLRRLPPTFGDVLPSEVAVVTRAQVERLGLDV